MNILVIDSNGVVGHVVALYLHEQGHDVTGYSETASKWFECIQGDLFDINMLQTVVTNGGYDAIINCSAIINQYAEEDKAKAVFINSYIPHFLEYITANTSTVVVHRSTDCIFSGKRGNYAVGDIPDAESFYAKSKVLGEIINDKDITIRTSLIGPETEESGGSLLNWYLKQRGEVRGFANAIWTGVTTIEFAKEIEQLLLQKAHGLFQCVPKNAISKYDLLCLFEKYFPGERNVVRIENERVDKSLVQEVLEYKIEIPTYDSMVSEMADWVKKHKDLYVNYKEVLGGYKYE